MRKSSKSFPANGMDLFSLSTYRFKLALVVLFDFVLDGHGGVVEDAAEKRKKKEKSACAEKVGLPETVFGEMRSYQLIFHFLRFYTFPILFHCTFILFCKS